MNPLKWTSRSMRALESALAHAGRTVCDTTIAQILKMQGYSLQANRKELAISPGHPDRNEQFEYINKMARAYMEAGMPVVSIEAKKKENGGNFKNNGHEYRKTGEPVEALDHDFSIKELGKARRMGFTTFSRTWDLST